MNFHVFELTPGEKMGQPSLPLTIACQVSKKPFLDYEREDFKDLPLIDLFRDGLPSDDKSFSVCKAQHKEKINMNGPYTLMYVKITGRVVFCKEVVLLLNETKDVERMLKEAIGPLQCSHQDGGLVDKIRERLNFHNNFDFDRKPHTEKLRELVQACLERDLDKQQVICGDFEREYCP